MSKSPDSEKRSFKIGGKKVSLDRLDYELSQILKVREEGATQEEAAQSFGVTRSFVSNIESLGAVPKSSQIAIIAFPVNNVSAIEECASTWGVERVFALSDSDLADASKQSGAEVFNQVLEMIAELAGFDALVLAASDYRIRTFSKFLNIQVVGIELGKSPLKESVELDIGKLEEVLATLLVERKKN